MTTLRRHSAGKKLHRRELSARGELAGHADVLAASCLSFFCVVGAAIAAPPTLFSSIAESVGVEVGELQLRLPTVLMLSWLLSTACAGSAMERLGVAPCIRLGSLAVALASTAYPLATSLRQLILLHAVLGASMGLAGVFAHCLLMNVWFLERRGTAIAIVVAFFGIANATWPPLLAAVATASSWRHAMWLPCAAQWLVSLPLSNHLVRCELGASRKPSAPLPADQGTAHLPPVPAETDPSSGSAALYLRTLPALALLAMSVGVGYVLFSLQNALVTYLQARARMPLREASAHFAALNAAQIVGKLAFGAALDSRRAARPAALLGCALAVGGCALLLRAETAFALPAPASAAAAASSLRAFVVLYGLGIGSSFALLASAPGREFRHLGCFPELQAAFGSAYLLGGLSGVACTGALTRSSGYGVAFGAITSSSALVLLAYVAFELAPRTPPSADDELPLPAKLHRRASSAARSPSAGADRRFSLLLDSSGGARGSCVGVVAAIDHGIDSAADGEGDAATGVRERGAGRAPAVELAQREWQLGAECPQPATRESAQVASRV